MTIEALRGCPDEFHQNDACGFGRFMIVSPGSLAPSPVPVINLSAGQDKFNDWLGSILKEHQHPLVVYREGSYGSCRIIIDESLFVGNIELKKTEKIVPHDLRQPPINRTERKSLGRHNYFYYSYLAPIGDLTRGEFSLEISGQLKDGNDFNRNIFFANPTP